MELEQIYQPIQEELENVEEILETSLKETRNKSLLKVNRFLLETPGKRLRPALVILSSKATSSKEQRVKSKELIKIASSIELIHIASLVHDDVVDNSDLRHHNPTVNFKWGEDVSIALGDYLYSLAFKLIADCTNSDILDCISSATKSMCEGELVQILERDNFSLSKERYIVIVKKKTASLFTASCQVGAITSNSPKPIENALRQYGLNFGIAFQVMDDYLDLTSSTQELGKPVGLDLTAGELTLPFLFLTEYERKKLLAQYKNPKEDLCSIRHSLDKLGVLTKTHKFIYRYIAQAKESLRACPDSEYKKRLERLVDFISQRARF